MEYRGAPPLLQAMISRDQSKRERPQALKSRSPFLNAPG